MAESPGLRDAGAEAASSGAGASHPHPGPQAGAHAHLPSRAQRPAAAQRLHPARLALRVYVGAVLLFLVLPILAIVPLSFSSGSLLVYPLPGLSLRWYGEVLTSATWMRALGNSLLIGALATGLAVVLGTLASLGLARRRDAWAAALKMLALSPMIVPVILIAVASYFFLAPLQLTGSYVGLVLTHTVIAVPFVVIPVLTALELLDPNLARAAAACGASPAATFWRVTLPGIRPAMASGALFAFAASFDDVVIALFIAGAQQRTLPQEMFSGLRDSITPAMLAVATLMIGVSTALYLAVARVQQRGRAALQARSA